MSLLTPRGVVSTPATENGKLWASFRGYLVRPVDEQPHPKVENFEGLDLPSSPY